MMCQDVSILENQDEQALTSPQHQIPITRNTNLSYLMGGYRVARLWVNTEQQMMCRS